MKASPGISLNFYEDQLVTILLPQLLQFAVRRPSGDHILLLVIANHIAANVRMIDCAYSAVLLWQVLHYFHHKIALA